MGDFSDVSDLGNSEVGSASDISETEKADADYGDGDGVNDFDETESEINQEDFEYQEGSDAKDVSEDKEELSSEENADQVSNEFEEDPEVQQDATTEQAIELQNEEPSEEMSSDEYADSISADFENDLEDDIEESSEVNDNASGSYEVESGADNDAENTSETQDDVGEDDTANETEEADANNETEGAEAETVSEIESEDTNDDVETTDADVNEDNSDTPEDQTDENKADETKTTYETNDTADVEDDTPEDNTGNSKENGEESDGLNDGTETVEDGNSTETADEVGKTTSETDDQAPENTDNNTDETATGKTAEPDGSDGNVDKTAESENYVNETADKAEDKPEDKPAETSEEESDDIENGNNTETTEDNGEATSETDETGDQMAESLDDKTDGTVVSETIESDGSDGNVDETTKSDNSTNEASGETQHEAQKPDMADSNAEKDSNDFSGAEKPADFQAKDVNETDNQESSSEARETSEDLKESLTKFEQDNWDAMTPEQQKEAIVELRDNVANDLGLHNKPDVRFYNVNDSTDFGGYSASQNAIYINEYNMGDASETADTIVHESRHSWQHERAENPISPEDFEFKDNFDNYITPDFDYDEYRNQPVEMDARDYASSVVDNIEKNIDVSTIEEPDKVEEREPDSYRELNEEKGAVFDKPDDINAKKVDLPDDIEAKRLEQYYNLRDGLVNDATWEKVSDYADRDGINLSNMSDEEKLDIANKTEEYKQEILGDSDKMSIINDKADALLEQSDARMNEAVNSGYSANDYYDIVNTPKNERTEEAYKESLEGSSLEQEFYDDFFKDDSNVAVCYMPADAYDKFVEKGGTLGRNDGQFVIPEHAANETEEKLSGSGTIENQTDEFKSNMESELGLPEGTFSSGIVRVEIPIDRDTLHMPYGTEGGANYQWVPGGKTLGDTREGIATQVTRDNDPDLFKDITSKVKRGA